MDQHALILGEGALDGQEQRLLGTVRPRRLGHEDDRHAQPAQFRQHDLLRAQIARQAIRTQTEHHLEAGQQRRVAQPIQAGARQLLAAHRLIQVGVFGRHLVAVRGRIVLKLRNLALDGRVLDLPAG